MAQGPRTFAYGQHLRVCHCDVSGHRCISASRRVDGWREYAPLAVYLVEVSAVLLIEAASVSTYRLVSERVQPILDSGPDTVRASVSGLPSGCGSTRCPALTVTPGQLASQVNDDPSASSVTV
jgi:hypothetical protein